MHRQAPPFPHTLQPGETRLVQLKSKSQQGISSRCSLVLTVPFVTATAHGVKVGLSNKPIQARSPLSFAQWAYDKEQGWGKKSAKNSAEEKCKSGQAWEPAWPTLLALPQADCLEGLF